MDGLVVTISMFLKPIWINFEKIVIKLFKLINYTCSYDSHQLQVIVVPKWCSINFGVT